jgi:hypothetical protein
MPDPITPAPGSAPASPDGGASPSPTPSPVPSPTPSPSPSPTPSPTATAAWPENWRNLYAGEDAKKLARLERFTDPAKALDALIEAQNKIRSGEMAKPLPENATPEQLAEWRAANGIPDKPDGYFAKLPNGLVIGKEDEKLFGEFATEMHKLNVPPNTMHKVVEWYYNLAERESAAVHEADQRQASEAIAALKETWGNDYKGNIGQVMSFLDGMGKELKAQFMDATLPDGRRLFNSPEIIQWIATQARELNPAGALIPNAGENQMQSIDTEIAGIEKVMRENRKAYNADQKMQERLRQLYGARDTLKKRVA